MNTNKQNKLRKLQDKYIALLPAKIDELNSAWQATLHDSTELNQLCQLAHNLAGSAGTFGFPSISIESRNLEETLRKLGSDQDLDDTTKKNLADTVQRIISLAERGPDKREIVAPVRHEATPLTDKFERLIYVIEDDELLAREIASQLYYFDYEVKTFSSTFQAAEAMQLRMPSAMIIDIQLPDGELAGPGFAKLFNEFSPSLVPSIFISARDDWQARLAAVQANGSAYLTKPLDFNDLFERLERLTMRHMPEPFKILIVDDMEVLAEHYATVLRNADMQVKTVSDISDLLEELSNFKPELILMDVHMPQCSGMDAAKIIRQKDELLGVPIVFLSTESDPLQHLSAIELGGDDFLQKPITDERLLLSVQARALRFRRLRSHMLCDGLTGLLNHVTIKTHLDSEISRAQRQGEALSFAMIDIDHFKDVNDTYGHPAGDRVIKSVARMLKKRLRKSDYVGRYGGEEFAIILPGTELETATKLLDDVRQNFSQITQQNHEVQFSCTLSAGVTQLTSNDSMDKLIKTADEALYEAKDNGRNRVCIK